MGFRDEGGNLVGFDIDLAQEASKRLGVPVEFKPIDWDSKEAALKSKQVDLLWNGLTITDERASKLPFLSLICTTSSFSSFGMIPRLRIVKAWPARS